MMRGAIRWVAALPIKIVVLCLGLFLGLVSLLMLPLLWTTTKLAEIAYGDKNPYKGEEDAGAEAEE